MTIQRAQVLEVLRSIYPFRRLDTDLLELVADTAGVVYFADGQQIFSQGDFGGLLYIVMGGQVALFLDHEVDDEAPPPFSIQRVGDIFGLEMVDFGERQVSATALGETTLLTIDADQLRTLETDIPKLGTALPLLLKSYLLSLDVALDWRGDKEGVCYIARRHRFFLWSRLLVPLTVALIAIPALVWLFTVFAERMLTPLVFTGAGVLAFILWVIWIVIDWRNDYSIITTQRVLFQEKILLLYDSRQEAPSNAILAVNLQTSQIGRMLGFGDVVVRTYAGLILMPGLEQPAEVAEMVEAEWFRSKSKVGRLERLERLREKYAARRNGERKIDGPPRQTEKPTESRRESLQEILATLFNLRYEKDGAITYRTHWFILLKKVWLPSALLLALQVTLVASAFGAISSISFRAVFAVVLLLDFLVGLWWAYQYWDWRNDFYVVTDEQIVDVYRKPLGHEERRSAPLRSIQSVNFERQGLIGLMLNFGTVHILVGETDLTFDFVYNPSEVQREIFKRFAERDYRDAQQQIHAEDERIMDWFEVYEHEQVGSNTDIELADTNVEDAEDETAG
ncbi:MAG: cyclic nucleotide-binding domain-containing protein [Anaerolineae bacterium]|nr:cyclic nucleotide-binding domain-containing protein [Anaerolineae bacterium]